MGGGAVAEPNAERIAFARFSYPVLISFVKVENRTTKRIKRVMKMPRGIAHVTLDIFKDIPEFLAGMVFLGGEGISIFFGREGIPIFFGRGGSPRFFGRGGSPRFFGKEFRGAATAAAAFVTVSRTPLNPC